VDLRGALSGNLKLPGQAARPAFSAINLAHVDLAGGQQRPEHPEQHGRGIRRWQHGLRLDSPFELLQPLDGT
jgi:hypothetical protein